MAIKPENVQPKPTTEQIVSQQQTTIERLREDLTELQDRYIALENAYLAEHKPPSPASQHILSVIAALCGIALIVILFLWFKSQDGLPNISTLFNS
jgi:hypothetical protein